MNRPSMRSHWEKVYATRGEHEVSWFQESPEISLALIEATGIARSATLIDVGGGASRLVDALLARGFGAITVLDLSEAALSSARARLGERAEAVKWIAADVTDLAARPGLL